MNCLKLRPFVFILTFVTGLAIVWGYFSLNQINRDFDEISISAVESDISQIFKVPKGNEIEIEIKYLQPKKAVVTVRNVSSTDVFMPYLPGKRDEWAFHSCLQEAKLNSQTGKFETLQGGSLACGMHPLPAKQSFKYVMWVPDSGSYIVKANYSIDKNLTQTIDNLIMIDQKVSDKNVSAEIHNRIEEYIETYVKVIPSKSIKL